MGRDHLKAYKKLENSSFDKLEQSINKYNQTVRNIVDETTSKIKLDIKTDVPTISEWDKAKSQLNNYYAFHNISRYLWIRFWEDEPKTILEITREGNNHTLVISQGKTVIAISDNQLDLQQLKQCLDSMTDEIINLMRTLATERENVESDFNNFKQTIRLIMRDISWNRLLKGKCGWERGSLSLR